MVAQLSDLGLPPFVRQDDGPSVTESDDLVAVEEERPDIGPGCLRVNPLHGAEAFGSILDHPQPVPSGQRADRIHIGRKTIR
jgi:hypothetical protein